VSGPYQDFEDAVSMIVGTPEEGLVVSTSLLEIWCARWSTEEFILRLDLASGNPPAELRLNGEPWFLEHLEHEQKRIRRKRQAGSG
jgi:hypothetical protein